MGTPRSRSGFSLIEVVIALAVGALGLFGTISVIMFAQRNNLATRENTIAMRATEKLIETMGALPIKDVFKAYDGTQKITDPKTGEQIPTDKFKIDGLNAVPGRTTHGQIYFPVTSGNLLVETETGKIMDRKDGARKYVNIDLDGDHVIDTTPNDKSSTYKVLPVMIELQWTGARGKRILSFRYTFVSKG